MHRSELFRNKGDGTFEEVADLVGLDIAQFVPVPKVDGISVSTLRGIVVYSQPLAIDQNVPCGSIVEELRSSCHIPTIEFDIDLFSVAGEKVHSTDDVVAGDYMMVVKRSFQAFNYKPLQDANGKRLPSWVQSLPGCPSLGQQDFPYLDINTCVECVLEMPWEESYSYSDFSDDSSWTCLLYTSPSPRD